MGRVTPSADPELVDFAAQIIREAGALTLQMFKAAELDVERKGDGTPVTVADRQAERYLRERIRDRFPDDEILGEEEPDQEGTSGRRWVIDPIDGTESFARGVALYTNLLYLEDEHGPAVGVINVPAIDEMVVAGRGLGCTFNGVPCHVNDHATLERSMMSTSGFDWWEPELLAAARRSTMGLRTWGDGYGYLLVATGRIEAMVDPSIKFWDVAPCQVIIPEAGGRWSALDGSADAQAGSFVATNGILHDQVLALLADTVA
jgi:histidinol phosphatase-like enzyme (inositol monophosphatase family)